MFGRATVGHVAASGCGFCELDGDAFDVGGGNSGFLLGPLGSVGFDLLAEVLERVVGPAIPESFVFESFLKNGVKHGSGDGTIGAGHESVKFVGLGSGVRRSDLEGDEFGPFFDAGFLKAMDHEESALVGFVRVAAEVDDILGVLEILGFPFELTTIK